MTIGAGTVSPPGADAAAVSHAPSQTSESPK